MGTPTAMSRALLMSDTARPNSAPTPNSGASTAYAASCNSQGVRHEHGGTARGGDQALDGNHRGKVDMRPDQPKGDPRADRARDPACQMQRRGQTHACRGPIDGIEAGGHRRGGCAGTTEQARGKFSGHPLAVALQGEKQGTPDRGQHEADQGNLGQRGGICGSRGVCAQDCEPQRDKGDLRQQLRGHVDDGRGKGKRRRNALQDRRTRAEHDPAELGKRQHLGGRIAHHPRSHENPGSRPARCRLQNVPSHPKQHEQRGRVQTQDRKAAPADRDRRREHGGEPDEHDEVEGECDSESRDDGYAQLHGRRRCEAC
jgi:hypothetical protein